MSDDDRYGNLIEFLPDAVVVHRAGTIVFANAAAAALIGARSPSDLVGRPALSLVHPEGRAVAAERMKRVGDGESRAEPLEQRLLRLDGAAFDAEVRSLPILYQGEPAALVIARDVTQGERIKRALEASEQKLRQIFDSSLDAIAINRHCGGAYLEVNREFERLTGFTASDAVGKTPGGLGIWADRRAAAALLEALERDGVVRDTEIELRRKDGRTIWALFSAVRMNLEGTLSVVSFTRDITDRKVAEEDLSRARDAALEASRVAHEASRLKSAFLANVSHEIRTPLNVILGLTSFVEDHLREIGDRSQDDCFDGIQQASRRLLNTIHGILDQSRIEAGSFAIDPVKLDVASIIDRQVKHFEPLARKKGVALVATVEADDASAVFDPYCLSQSLMNLLDNAIKFTAKGRVGVRLYRAESGALTIDVEDTGVGIDRAFLPHLFKPFSQEEVGYSRAFEGSGLGLALVRKYLEMNGATIQADSRKNEGSLFRIRFAAGAPVASLAARRRKVEAAASPTAGAEKPTVLVVEDDSVTQFYMAKLLGRSCDVILASGGEELRLQLAARGDEVALVVMDLSLRGSEDGLDLTRYLRRQAKWKHVPIIAVTAHAMPKDRRNALEAGCDDYVAKPVDSQELLGKMAKLLSRDAQAASPATATAVG